MPFPWNTTLCKNPLATQITATAEILLGESFALTARTLTDATAEEYWACHPCRGAAGFERFCDKFVIIYDQKARLEVPMDLFEGQREVVPDLVKGAWLVLLKGRQLGLTWLLVAYVVWLITYRRRLTCIIVNQQKEYAQDFITRVKDTIDRLPPWLQKDITTNNKESIELKAAPNKILVRAIVGGQKAGRSMTVDLAILDEASRIPELDKTMTAIQPGVESAGGQIVALSSSAGPQGYFYESWRGSYGDDGELLRPDGRGPNGFKPIFIHWSKRKGRTPEWYAREKEKLDAISPVAIKQEHPENPQEAWEYAAGRIYPLFRRELNVGDIPDLPLNAVRYRAIDWGSVESPFVVLWLVYIPGPSAFLVSPKCPNTIREFFAYRWDEDIEEDKEQKPLKRDDHTCDAVRYAITTFHLTGLVWVYREHYEVNSVAKGWNIMNEIEMIHRMSGWEEAPDDVRAVWWPGDGETYQGTVADRSWAKAISTYCANDIPCVGHKVISRKQEGKLLTDRPLTETLEGIRQVSALIDGSRNVDKIMRVTRERLAMRVLAQTGMSATSGLEDRSLAQYARRLMAAQRRKDRF
jgi:hypothetical protein